MMTRGKAIALSAIDLRKLLAHREPYLLVSHAIDNILGKSITVVASQTSNNFFPHQLQILEALGQASAVLIRQMPQYKHKGQPVFAAMRDVTWHIPSETNSVPLLLTAQLQRPARKKFGFVTAFATLNHQTICTASLTFSFQKSS